MSVRRVDNLVGPEPAITAVADQIGQMALTTTVHQSIKKVNEMADVMACIQEDGATRQPAELAGLLYGGYRISFPDKIY